MTDGDTTASIELLDLDLFQGVATLVASEPEIQAMIMFLQDPYAVVDEKGKLIVECDYSAAPTTEENDDDD